jgi:diguanylate cyclase (GGDEF)-like protein/PAS domain S-box-containing protein
MSSAAQRLVTPLSSAPTPSAKPDGGELGCYREIVEEAKCWIIKIRTDGIVSFVNRFAAEFFERPPEALVGRPLVGEMISPVDTMDPPIESLVATLRGRAGAQASWETLIHAPDGNQVWIAWSTTGLFDAQGELVELVAVGADISERKKLETELIRLAITDPLTGAFNRRYLVETGDRESDRARRYSTPCSILIIDIDHFKSVNDTYGHAIGDTTLQALTHACRKMLRGSDTFGRLGGEEFAVILPQANLEHATNLAERIRRAVSRLEVPTPKGAVTFTISIGAAQLQADRENFNEALIRADAALYAAKQGGRNRVVAAR